MRLIPRRLIAALALLAFALSMPALVFAEEKGGRTRSGGGPVHPTRGETPKAFEPFFAYVAKKLNREFDLVATTDWAGISVALANEQVDVAWMGPWGYVLANADSG